MAEIEFSENQGMGKTRGQEETIGQRFGSESILHGSRHGHMAEHSGKVNAELTGTKQCSG